MLQHVAVCCRLISRGCEGNTARSAEAKDQRGSKGRRGGGGGDRGYCAEVQGGSEGGLEVWEERERVWAWAEQREMHKRESTHVARLC